MAIALKSNLASSSRAAKWVKNNVALLSSSQDARFYKFRWVGGKMRLGVGLRGDGPDGAAVAGAGVNLGLDPVNAQVR
jgi:hypothetical protein